MANGNGKTILGGLSGKAEGALKKRKSRIEEAIDEATKVEPEPPAMPTNGNGMNGNGTRRRRDNYPWD